MIGSVAPWFGAKRILASQIVAEIGPAKAYWEPFCGSCAVLMAKPAMGTETVNDLHGHLTHVLRVLCSRKASERLYGHLIRMVPSEGLWRHAKYYVRKNDPPELEIDVELAGHWLYASWLSRNGLGGTEDFASSFAVRYTDKGGGQVARWRNVVASIPDWHERLKNVCVLQRDALELLARIEDAPGTVIYCDPPYLTEGGLYIHGLTEDKQIQLSSLLKRFKHTRVVLSYYDDARLAKWYPGWTVRRMDLTKTMGERDNDAHDGSVNKAPEVLLINGPSYVEAPSLWPI